MQFPELRRRRRPHCGDARATDVAQILKCLEEIIEKRRDAVGAGEDEPIVSVQPAQRLHNSFAFRRRNDFDRGDLQNLRPALEQLARKLTRLIARARDHDALAEQ